MAENCSKFAIKTLRPGFDVNFRKCFFDLFFWQSSFEVTLLYFALDKYFFYSVSIFNFDLLCCLLVLCIFVINLI